MNQEITYSPTLINFLNSDHSILDISKQQKVWELIKQNYIACDSELKILKTYGELVRQLPNSGLKLELQNFVEALINDKANKRKTFKVISSANNYEIELALSSNDKIYLQPLLSKKEVKKINITYGELETHNSESFINPQAQHRLKHLPTIIPLQKEFFYDIVKIFSPFLRNSKNALIEDPYLANPLASQNVLKIIEKFPNVNFDLTFLTRDLFSEHKSNIEKLKQYDSFIESISELVKNGYTINYNNHFKTKKHRERFIFTENFQIYIPGGFDFLNEYGYLKNQTSFDISEKLEIRIEKRTF
jgi:hypothetical protein